jgi:hypothetical protein
VIAAIIPACITGVLILKNWVDLPQWDEWTMALFLDKLDLNTDSGGSGFELF